MSYVQKVEKDNEVANSNLVPNTYGKFPFSAEYSHFITTIHRTFFNIFVRIFFIIATGTRAISNIAHVLYYI